MPYELTEFEQAVIAISQMFPLLLVVLSALSALVLAGVGR